MPLVDNCLPFGVGSIFFALDSTSKLSEWQEAVADTLNAIPSISDMRINLPEEFKLRHQVGKPYPAVGGVSFRITIPESFRKELLVPQMTSLAGDKFTVVILHESRHPVAFVIAEQAKSARAGAAGVILVRNFLVRELRLRPGKAYLNTLGPSPFHVNFSLEPADQTEEFILKVIPSRGYQTYRFTYSEGRFSSLPKAGTELFLRLRDELAYFYHLAEVANNRRAMVRGVTNRTQDLVTKFQDPDLKARIANFFLVGMAMRKIVLETIAVDYAVQRSVSQSMQDLEELYDREQFPCFRTYLEKQASDKYIATYISGCKDTLAMLSQDRSQQVQITSLFISALAGGFAGALVTLLIH